MNKDDILDLIPLTDLALLGIRHADILQSEMLRKKEGHVVFRLQIERGWFVLKWFEQDDSLEPHVYNLLERHGVPTLPLHACSTQALLLEDLEHSTRWRKATPADMSAEATGLAVAEWYKSLHQAGSQIFRNQVTMPVALHPWVEELSVESLTRAGVRLGLTNLPAWPEAVHSIEPLKVKARRFPQTFNYDDFAQENLALSRDPNKPLQAVVFDYDCFTIGAAYTDWRNVTFSLDGKARKAFINAYGPVSQAERLLDAPLSTFFGLLVASRRATLPGWAHPLLKSVEDGSFLRSVHAALQN